MRAFTVFMLTVAGILFGAAQVLAAVAAHMEAINPAAK
jgi:hypothetical protein